jgi:hypothetical protein
MPRSAEPARQYVDVEHREEVEVPEHQIRHVVDVQWIDAQRRESREAVPPVPHPAEAADAEV